MAQDWDLIVVDLLFNVHGFSISIRLNAEKHTKYVLFETSGTASQITAVSTSLGKLFLVSIFIHLRFRPKPTVETIFLSSGPYFTDRYL